MLRVTAIVIVVLALAGPAAADALGNGNALLSINGAYVTSKAEATGQNVDGVGLIAALDVFDATRPFSIWVSLSVAQQTAQNQENNDQVQRTLRTFPLFVGIRYWLGSNKFRGYIGAGIGIYFSTLETTFPSISQSSSSSTESLATSIPLGVVYEIGSKTTINAGYSMNVMFDNTFLEGSMMHNLGIGVGFSFGS